MSAAAELRKQIESALAGRIPAALSFRPPCSPELLSCGLAEVDAMLGGGVPLGAITELTGAPSSGRTTLALATLSELTQQGQSCAYVDVCDALDPLSASAQGVDLHRLLWVRPRSPAAPGLVSARAGTSQPAALRLDQARLDQARLDHGLRATDLLLSTGGFRALVLDLGDMPPEQARRVPLATWYRFRLQAEKSRTLFLLITSAQGCGPGCGPGYAPGYAQSCAAVSLHFQPASPDWQQATLHRHAPPLLAGLRCRLSLGRSRVDPTPASVTGGPSVGPYPPRKKPAAAAPATEAAWSSTTLWAR
jgi:hypothetical protein